MERRVTLRDSHMIALLLVTSAKREEMREGSQVIIVVAVIPIVRPFRKTWSSRARSMHKSRHPTNILEIKAMANLSYNKPGIIDPERVCLLSVPYRYGGKEGC